MSKTASSRRWLQRQSKDPYVKQARQRGLHSRAVFKLEQIDRLHHLFRPGMTVIDLGAAPGGWSQYAARRVGCRGRVISTDILPLVSLDGVEFVQGDLREEHVVKQLLASLGGQKADVVISDMAPNASGMTSIDQPRSMYLAELALELAPFFLKPGGHFLSKLFQGDGFNEFIVRAHALFTEMTIKKPHASRARNREVYLLGLTMLEGVHVEYRTHLG